MKHFIAAAALAVCASSAHATTYEYSSEILNGLESTYRFNTATDEFGLSFTVNDSDHIDGAWWVVNDGPTPRRNTEGDYAIFYTDLANVWALQYTGGYNINGSGGLLLQYWENAVDTNASGGQSTYSVELDLTDLNNRHITETSLGLPSTWTGLQFDDMIGTWLHGTRNSFDHCAPGANTATQFTCFNGNNWNGWDEANRPTTIVPAPIPLPAGLPLMLAPLALGAVVARRKAVAA